MTVVVIPAYQPDKQLTELVKELYRFGVSTLIINDGSDSSYDHIFEEVAKQAKVIRSEKNEGKGAALKKGFSALLEYFPECTCIITADADGQHKVEDILRVRDEIESGADFILTVRRFPENMPFRSKFGNDLSRVVYTVASGHYFDDNQSGLRGFSTEHIDWLLKVKGNKYDYEMNMLCYADKQGIKINLLPIEAVYIDGNQSSHFNPIPDTIRIYKRLFASIWPSIVGVILWEVLTIIFTTVFGYKYSHFTISTAVMISAFVTVLLHKYVAFRKVRYRDGLRTLLYSIIRAGVYFTAVRLVGLITQSVPAVIIVNVAAVIFVIIEYYIHKKMRRLFK